MISESKTLKINTLVPLILAFMIPTKVFVPVTILCFLYVLIERLWSKKIDFRFLKTEINVMMLASVFVLLAGLVTSQNIKNGFNEIERNSMLVILPFMIYQWKQFSVKVTQLIFAFLAGLTMMTLYGFFNAVQKLDTVGFKRMLEEGHSYYSEYLFIHPTYLALFLIFGFFFILEYIREHKSLLSKRKLISLGVALVYFAALIFFLRARISIFIFCFTSLVYCIIIIRSISRKILVSASVVLLFCAVWFSADFDALISTYGRNGLWALNDRLSLWASAWEGYKLSPLTGGGTGNAQQLIDEGYLKTGYDYGLDNAYNAHNQYLQNLCRNGVLDLLILLLISGYGYYYAWVKKQILFFIFLMITNITMITESILQREKGVAFFYFFLCAFVYLKDE